MNSFPRSTAIIPLPAFSPLLTGEYPANDLGLRRFGMFESDLAIDFTLSNIPVLIGRILEQCTIDSRKRLPEDFFRELSVGKRLECLLALASGEKCLPFIFPFHCTGCGQELEMELTLEEIMEQQRAADLIKTVKVEIGGEAFLFRKPCGRDQEIWAGMVFEDEKEAAMAMVGILAVDSDITKLDAKNFDLLDKAMDEADPLVNFLCRINCSECDATNEFFIDLCDTALGMLNRLQQQLIVMVHKLASHYNWSEKEIFEVPHWRRMEYLELIAAGR